jgi:uncharacterized protein YabE (DUF348 family)
MFNNLSKYFLVNPKREIIISLILSLSIVCGAGAFWVFDERKTVSPISKKIDLYYDGHLFKVETKKETVGQLLAEQGIDLAEEDVVFPSVDTEIFSGSDIYFKKAIISNGQKIKVTRINIEEIEKEEEIPFEIKEEEDDDLKWRKKEIEREGETGIKKVKYRITYKDGQEISREKLSSKIIKKPVNEIIKVGTKIEVGKTKIGLASWYAHTGTMACASRMFPRGTWLRVTNRATGKQIFVVVNDYGPMRGTGKMIDLDKVAFEKIAPLGQGVVEVKVEEILN